MRKEVCCNCEHYCKFKDEPNRGICDKTESWKTVFANNKGCEDIKSNTD